MYFSIDFSANPLICYQYDEKTSEYSLTKMETQLNYNFKVLTFIHFISFVMLTVVKIIDVVDVNAHYSVIISLLTIPLY